MSSGRALCPAFFYAAIRPRPKVYRGKTMGERGRRNGELLDKRGRLVEIISGLDSSDVVLHVLFFVRCKILFTIGHFSVKNLVGTGMELPVPSELQVKA